MTRTQKVVIGLVLGVAVLAAIPCGFLGLWAVASGGSNRGSPELAEEWRAELSQYQTPEEAQAKNPDVIVVRFDNGEWVFGRCQSSHGMWKRGGGTVVVKDSKGQVRAFFGHVCGDGNLGANWERTSLQMYYSQTLSPETGFVEHKFQ